METLVKEPQTIEEIKVGDVWSSSWGYDQTNVDFYKVIKKTNKMIWLRKIGQIYVKQTSWASEDVLPDPTNELWERDYIKREKLAKMPEAQLLEEDKGEGAYVYVKYPAISKHLVQSFGHSGGLYVKLSSYSHATPFDGRPLHQSHWA